MTQTSFSSALPSPASTKLLAVCASVCRVKHRIAIACRYCVSSTDPSNERRLTTRVESMELIVSCTASYILLMPSRFWCARPNTGDADYGHSDTGISWLNGMSTDIMQVLSVHACVYAKARTLIASRFCSGGVGSAGCCPL